MRQLSRIEQAFTITNESYPLSVVCVLELTNGPDTARLKQALNKIQRTHSLLNAEIIKEKRDFRFVPMQQTPEIPLQLVDRAHNDTWKEIATTALNSSLRKSEGPLMRVIYIRSSVPFSDAEIILVFHHAIVDGDALICLARQLLSEAGKPADTLNEKTESQAGISPQMEDILPATFRSGKLIYRLGSFVARQLADEMVYRVKGSAKDDHPIPESSINDLITVSFSEATTSSLVRYSRKLKISMNSLLAAAMLLSVHKIRYTGKNRLMRMIVFARLRAYLDPPVAPHQLGCFISMMRFTSSIKTTSRVEEVAVRLNRLIEQSGRRGEKFLNAYLSRLLVRQTIRRHNRRLGHVALSYSGPVNFNETYGSIRFRGIHGFITNNRLGPEFSGSGHIHKGKLNLDLNYLISEMSRKEAMEITDEMIRLLEEAILIL